MNCNLCPRGCNIDRNSALGYCQKSNEAEISKVMLHSGEEPYLSGDGKSGAIFFAGCNLKCVYCQNYSISRGTGKRVSAQTIANLFVQLEQAGAANIDLVTPTHYAAQIVEAIKIYRPQIPIVYNCGGYETPEVIKELCNYVDVFLFDLKYHSNELAIKYSSAPHYFDYATKSILTAVKNKPNVWIGDKLVQGVAIRHLCLPSHTTDSFKVIDWLSENTPASSPISIMGQYTPCGDAKKYEEINRPLKPLEYKAIISHAKKLKNNVVLVQELSSATEDMIPDFNHQDNKFIY
ncbi:MAG: radical SAM protein [Clostridia bacterium]|nr:radical SAM protein [Clostridia bacterium]